MQTLPRKVSFGYAAGQLGSVSVYSMTACFMTIFYTDVFGISAAAVSTIYLVCRVFDAFNDPVMGVVVDRTTTRWGRFRPFIMVAVFPFAAIFALTYFTPSLSYTGKIAWAFLTTFVLYIFFTIVDVPYHSLQPVLTRDAQVQSEIGTLKNVFSMLAFLIVATSVPSIVKLFATPQKGYFFSALMLGIVMIVSYTVVVITTRKYDRLERLRENEKASPGRPALKNSLVVISQNRPFLCLSAAFLLIQISVASLTLMVVYVFKYYLLQPGFYSPFMGVYLIASLLGAVITPFLTKRMGKKNAFQLSNLVSALFQLLIFIVVVTMGQEAASASIKFGALFFIAMAGAFSAGPVVATIYGMFPDTVTYAEWKTGIRSEGLIFAVMNFMTKSGVALGGTLAAAGLSFVKYVPNQVQTESTLLGILVIWLLMPCTAKIIAGFIMHYYELDKIYPKIIRELNQEHTGESDEKA